MPKSTQSRKPVQRSIHPLGGNLFRIEVGKSWDVYSIEQVPCDLGGVAFSVGALTVERAAPLYHVHVERPGVATCDCIAASKGTRCKHRDGILHLQKFGLLPTAHVSDEAAMHADLAAGLNQPWNL